MSTASNPSLIVVSPWQAGLSEAANLRHLDEAKAMLDDAYLPFKVGRGCYRGQEEPCLLIACGGDLLGGVRMGVRIMLRFNQESLLAVRDNNEAALFYSDLSVEPVGYWQVVPEWYATTRECWTLVDGEYYVTS